jgi:hypothetical protein
MALQLSKKELKIRNYIKQSFKTIVESATLKIGGCNIQRINIIKLKIIIVGYAGKLKCLHLNSLTITKAFYTVKLLRG